MLKLKAESQGELSAYFEKECQMLERIMIIASLLSINQCIAMENNFLDEREAPNKRRSSKKLSVEIRPTKYVLKSKIPDPFAHLNLNNALTKPLETLTIHKINSFQTLDDIIKDDKGDLRFLVVDIDKTLLDQNETLICKNTPDILRKLAKLGFCIVFATARESDPLSRAATYAALKNAGIHPLELTQMAEKFYLRIVVVKKHLLKLAKTTEISASSNLQFYLPALRVLKGVSSQSCCCLIRLTFKMLR